MTMPTDWWRDFFSGLATDFWHAMPTPAMTADEVDVVLRRMAPPAGGRLLDVPCGDARHACELAARGYAVDAVDRSAAMLAFARTAAAGRTVTVHERDMRDLPWPAAFDGACCLGNSFAYLGDEGDAQFLAAVRAALRPGARFVLDAATLEAALPSFVPRSWYEAGGVLFCRNASFDPSAGVIRSDYTMVRGTEVQRRSAWLRVRSVHDVLGMLTGAGFREAVAVDDRGAPWLLGSGRLWFIAIA